MWIATGKYSKIMPLWQVFMEMSLLGIEDLLYGTILPSGGECARSLAINIAGSEEGFVILMNEKAKELGLKNTNYKSSVGLDQEGHYSSAEDTGKILKYGYLDKDFRKILTSPNYLSTETIDHPQGLYMESTVLSKLTFYEQKGFRIFGGKSGTTKNAGYC